MLNPAPNGYVSPAKNYPLKKAFTPHLWTSGQCRRFWPYPVGKILGSDDTGTVSVSCSGYSTVWFMSSYCLPPDCGDVLSRRPGIYFRKPGSHSKFTPARTEEHTSEH